MIIGFDNVSKVYSNNVEKSRRQAVRNIFFKKKNGAKGDEVFGIKDISFSVREKRPFLILGPAKSGKTTIARLICGMSKPTFGSVNVAGSARMVSYRSVSATPFMTVINYLKLYCMCHNAKAGDIQDLCAGILKKLGYDRFAGEAISRFPAENMKKLNYYTSLSIDSDIYVFDEAIKNDASDFGSLCMERLKEICNTRTMVILSKESYHLPFKVGDGLVLSEGNLIYCGELEKLNVQAVISHATRENKTDNINQEPAGKNHEHNELGQLLSIKLTNTDGNAPETIVDMKGNEGISSAQDIFVEILFRVFETGISIMGAVDVHAKNVYVFGGRQPYIKIDKPGTYRSRLKIPSHLFTMNTYSMDVSVIMYCESVKYKIGRPNALKFLVLVPVSGIQGQIPVPVLKGPLVSPDLEWDFLFDQQGDLA